MAIIIDFTKYRKKIERIDPEEELKYRYVAEKKHFWEELELNEKKKYILENNLYLEDYIEFVESNKNRLEEGSIYPIISYANWIEQMFFNTYNDTMDCEDDYENDDEEDLSDYPI